jgi:hypothetical protein
MISRTELIHNVNAILDLEVGGTLFIDGVDVGVTKQALGCHALGGRRFNFFQTQDRFETTVRRMEDIPSSHNRTPEQHLEDHMIRKDAGMRRRALERDKASVDNAATMAKFEADVARHKAKLEEIKRNFPATKPTKLPLSHRFKLALLKTPFFKEAK